MTRVFERTYVLHEAEAQSSVVESALALEAVHAAADKLLEASVEKKPSKEYPGKVEMTVRVGLRGPGARGVQARDGQEVPTPPGDENDEG
jgi:hypothetical protein